MIAKRANLDVNLLFVNSSFLSTNCHVSFLSNFLFFMILLFAWISYLLHDLYISDLIYIHLQYLRCLGFIQKGVCHSTNLK